jgi:hypothetical protein
MWVECWETAHNGQISFAAHSEERWLKRDVRKELQSKGGA